MTIQRFHDPTPSLVALFGSLKSGISRVLKDLLHITKENTLVVDINHRWSSLDIGDNCRIIQPNSRSELLFLLENLTGYIHPRLSWVLIDDLPLYFRDFYRRDKIQTQNMRAFGASLALLDHLSHEVNTLFTTYANGINPTKPILENHTKYYCDAIFRVKQIKSHTYKFRELSSDDQFVKTLSKE